MKFKELETIIHKSKEILKSLKQKHPEMDAYLVISSPLGQCNLSTSAIEAFQKFPEMFISSATKEGVVSLQSELEDQLYEIEHLPLMQSTSERERAATLTLELAILIAELELDESTQVEIRFGELRYNLVFALQSDPLVDQKLTPQSRGSIRIVLGTLRSLR